MSNKNRQCNRNWYIYTSKLAAKCDLASLQAEVDKLDIDKLIPVPVDLSKVSDVLKSVVKESVYDKLVATIKNIDTSGLFQKLSTTEISQI